MTAVGSPNLGALWLPPVQTRNPLRNWLTNEWQRLLVQPLLMADRAGVAPRRRSSQAGRTAGAGSHGSNTAPTVEISSPAEIHALEPAMQLTYLVENYSDAVYRVARSVVRENDLAEDASQEALLKAWQALPTYRGDAPLRNWVLRITHNTAVSILRSRREDVRDPELLPDSVQRGNIERSVEDRMAITAFEDALGRLDELSRSIVVLREIENMSYDEIADVLNIGLPTVKTRLLRARRVLSSALEEWRP